MYDVFADVHGEFVDSLGSAGGLSGVSVDSVEDLWTLCGVLVESAECS